MIIRNSSVLLLLMVIKNKKGTNLDSQESDSSNSPQSKESDSSGLYIYLPHLEESRGTGLLLRSWSPRFAAATSPPPRREPCRTRSTTSTPRPTPGPPRPTPSRRERSGRMGTSSSRRGPARLLTFQLPRLGSMGMRSVTLLLLIFSMAKSLRILCHLHTIVMFRMSTVLTIS